MQGMNKRSVQVMWTLQIIGLLETLKVLDNKVTHHSHQKGAYGLDGEVSFTPKGHRGKSWTPIVPIWLGSDSVPTRFRHERL